MTNDEIRALVKRLKNRIKVWAEICFPETPGILASDGNEPMPAMLKALKDAAAALEAWLAEREWQDISTAPKDDTPIDLWIVSKEHQWRVPNCRRSYEGGNWPDIWTSDGKYVNGSRYYEDGDECFRPGNVPHSKARIATIATHWRPLPPAPETQKARPIR